MHANSALSATHLNATLGKNAVRVLDWLSLVVWGLVAVVGIMQAKQYNGGWLTSYGGDVFGPIALWWGSRRTIFASTGYSAEIAALTQLISGVIVLMQARRLGQTSHDGLLEVYEGGKNEPSLRVASSSSNSGSVMRYRTTRGAISSLRSTNCL